MESLGLILLIPFSVCFVLLFVVCCFADELKKMCRMPNQLPLNYVPEERARNSRRRQRQRSRARYDQHRHFDDAQSLMANRSRNSSGDSMATDTNPFDVIAVVTSEVLPNGRVIQSHVDARSLLSVSQTLVEPTPGTSQSDLHVVTVCSISSTNS